MAEARAYHDMTVLEGKVYAVGGSLGGGALSSVERYDPALDLVRGRPGGADGAEARHDHAVAVLDGKLYAVTWWEINK